MGLSPRDEAALLRAEQRVKRAERALARAKDARTKTRARLAPGFPVGEWVELSSVGKRIRRRHKSGGRSFRLKDYEARFGLTKRMHAFITNASGYDVWDIEDAE